MDRINVKRIGQRFRKKKKIEIPRSQEGTFMGKERVIGRRSVKKVLKGGVQRKWE